MNKISKYHSSIKVKSKNIKSNVVKDYICCLPELQIISCRRQHLKQDFPQRFLAFRLPPKNIHLNSDDPMNPMIIQKEEAVFTYNLFSPS